MQKFNVILVLNDKGYIVAELEIDYPKVVPIYLDVGLDKYQVIKIKDTDIFVDLLD